MALTIHQSPTTSINASNSDILYVVSSPSSSNANYQYVCDVLDADDERVVRLKQRPNPDGQIGVFNLGRIIHKNVYGDSQDYNTYMFTGATNNVKVYKVKFGEEWGLGVTSSIVLYDGNGVEGDPAVSSSLEDYTYFTGITLDRNESTTSTFDSSTYFGASFSAGDVNLSLTNIPRTSIPIRESDYHTVSLFNGPSDETESTINDIYKVRFKYRSGLDGQGSLTGEEEFTNAQFTFGGGGAPRQTTIASFPTAPFFAAKYYNRVTTVQIGTKFLTIPANTLSYTADIQNYDGEYYDLFTFNLSQDEDCPYPFYRLMWLNKFGTYDYYNFEGRNKYSNKRKDTKYGKGFIDYSIGSSGTNPYNIGNRGIKNYFTERTQEVTVTTKFLTLEWANYLEGLFESSDVFLLEGINAVPINLKSADYKKFTDPRSEKKRSYEIKFEYSNTKRPY